MSEYAAKSFFGNYTGVEDTIVTDDIIIFHDWIWEKVSQGLYVETDEKVRYSPAKLSLAKDKLGIDYFDGMISDGDKSIISDNNEFINDYLDDRFFDNEADRLGFTRYGFLLKIIYDGIGQPEYARDEILKSCMKDIVEERNAIFSRPVELLVDEGVGNVKYDGFAHTITYGHVEKYFKANNKKSEYEILTGSILGSNSILEIEMSESRKPYTVVMYLDGVELPLTDELRNNIVKNLVAVHSKERDYRDYSYTPIKDADREHLYYSTKDEER